MAQLTHVEARKEEKSRHKTYAKFASLLIMKIVWPRDQLVYTACLRNNVVSKELYRPLLIFYSVKSIY